MEAKDLIVQLKEIKARCRISYSDLLQALTVNDVPVVSRTTLIRVFASGSEDRATSFNYEETLLPISNAIKQISGEVDLSPEEVIAELKEEVNRLSELNSNMSAQLSENDALIKRLVNRLDQKDEIIHQFLEDMRKKDDLIRCMTNKIKT